MNPKTHLNRKNTKNETTAAKKQQPVRSVAGALAEYAVVKPWATLAEIRGQLCWRGLGKVLQHPADAGDGE